MREIKFRAWDTEFHLMHTNDSECAICLTGDLLCFNSDIEGTGIEAWTPIRRDSRYVLMQFTGLLDKNGKEIYEGDIISYNFGIFKMKPVEVKFENGSFFEVADINWEDYRKHINRNDFEIIGNVYQNRELLK